MQKVKVWPFSEPLGLMLQMLRGVKPGPASFGEWRPAKDDVNAWSLLEAMECLAEPCVQSSRDADSLATALNRFLSGNCSMQKAERDGPVWRLPLPALVDSRIPCALHSGGVEVQVPAEPGSRPATPMAGLSLWLSSGEDTEGEAGIVRLSATRLLELMQIRQDRVTHLIRAVGARMALARALPESILGVDVFKGAHPASLRSSVMWVLDVLNVMANPGTAEALVYYGGGFPNLLYELMRRAVWNIDRSDGFPLGIEHVRAVWQRADFRVAAAAELLAATRPGSCDRLVLAAIPLAAEERGGEVTQVQILDVASTLLGTTLSESEVANAVAELARSGVVNQSGDRLSLPQSGAGRLLRDFILSDPESFARGDSDAAQ
ncbi:MAG: hypothetical protein HQ559_10200 [Lentisphaerae bacterium]|nr:hypothetical protein [Lentisphaerota bacterium]